MRSEAIIPLLLVPLLDDKDFLFHPMAKTNLILFAHIIYHKTTKVLIRNTFDQPLRISHHQKLGHVVDIRYNNYFLADAKFLFNATIFPPQTSPFFEYELSCISIPANLSMEMKLHNGVRVYGDKYAVILLAQLVAKYPSIGKSEGFVQIPHEYWIKVPLKPEWEAKISAIRPRIYPLRNKVCQLVDGTFDRMHCLRHLKFIFEYTPFSFFVFVV